MDREQVINYEIGLCVMLYILSSERTAQQLFYPQNRTLQPVVGEFTSRVLDCSLIPEFDKFSTSASKMTLMMGGPLAVRGVERSGQIIEQAIRSQRRPHGREQAAARTSLYYDFGDLWTRSHQNFFSAVRPHNETAWDEDIRMFLGIDRRQIRFFRSVQALRNIWENEDLTHELIADTLQKVREEYEREFIYMRTQDQSQHTDKIRVSYEFTTAYLIQQEAQATNFQEVVGVGLNSICSDWFSHINDTQRIAFIMSHWYFGQDELNLVENEDHFLNEMHHISMYGSPYLTQESAQNIIDIISKNAEAHMLIEAVRWLEANRKIIRNRAHRITFKMPNSPYWISRERIESIWRGEENDRFPVCFIDSTHVL